MAIQRISTNGLEAIGRFQGGAVNAQFVRQMKRAIDDCDDRPGDDKTRKVILTVEMKPIPQGHGHAPHVEMVARVKSSVPDHVSRPVEAKVLHGGDAAFNDLSESNVDQQTIDQARDV